MFALFNFLSIIGNYLYRSLHGLYWYCYKVLVYLKNRSSPMTSKSSDFALCSPTKKALGVSKRVRFKCFSKLQTANYLWFNFLKHFEKCQLQCDYYNIRNIILLMYPYISLILNIIENNLTMTMSSILTSTLKVYFKEYWYCLFCQTD